MSDIREGLHDSADSTALVGSDVGNAQSVDDGPGLLGKIWKFWWVIGIAVVLLTVALSQMFPEWAKKNKSELDEITAVADTSTRLLQKATKVKWGDLVTKQRIRSIKYVGTGLHPDLRKDPMLRKKYFFQGEVHIKKDYVKDWDMLTIAERQRLNKKGGLKFPAIGVSFSEASEYCHNLGEGYRLPTYRELYTAENLAKKKTKKKVSGPVMKPNMVFRVYGDKDQWTSTPQPSSGWFFGIRTGGDNYRIYSSKSHDGERYEDDGYDDENLSFRCVKEPVKKF
jgi:hypothetical protein